MDKGERAVVKRKLMSQQLNYLTTSPIPRQMISLSRALAKRLAAIERRLTGHDADVRHLYRIMRELHKPPRPGEIGFKSGEHSR